MLCDENVPQKLKSKEAKHVGDILELSETFRSLADANMAGLGDDTRAAAEAKIDGAEGKDGARFSRLSVGLAVREVICHVAAFPALVCCIFCCCKMLISLPACVSCSEYLPEISYVVLNLSPRPRRTDSYFEAT